MSQRAAYGAALSPRETQVAIAILFGHTRAQMAREFHISLGTLNTHRYNLFAKFGVHNGLGLARLLMREAGA